MPPAQLNCTTSGPIFGFAFDWWSKSKMRSMAWSILTGSSVSVCSKQASSLRTLLWHRLSSSKFFVSWYADFRPLYRYPFLGSSCHLRLSSFEKVLPDMSCSSSFLYFDGKVGAYSEAFLSTIESCEARIRSYGGVARCTQAAGGAGAIRDVGHSGRGPFGTCGLDGRGYAERAPVGPASGCCRGAATLLPSRFGTRSLAGSWPA